MSLIARLPPWVRVLLVAFALLAALRALALVLHRPLLAFANNYDQIRYTACLDLAPWRPGVAADAGNPQAPLSRYAFQPLPAGTCIWTSDLLFTAPVALAWTVSERLGARAIHSVQRMAEWRLLLWFAFAAWMTVALLRAGRADVALAHLGWLALFGTDPANLLYFATFYAEAAAISGFFLCVGASVVALVRPTRGALALAAIGAIVLAASKFQHLLLPVLLGVALLFGAGRGGRKAALAVLAGALLGLGVQVADVVRDPPMAHGVNTVNRADFVLTVLLPETSDRAHVAAALELDDACLAYAGKSVYAMPQFVDRICTRVNDWPRTLPWRLLIADPPALLRALGHVPRYLLPWIPGLGLVEGGTFTPLPRTIPSWSSLFGESRAMATGLLALPWLVFGVCLARRAPAPARGFALMCATGSSAVAVVALFGDGDVEYAKHAQLAIDFSLASLGVAFAALARRGLPEELRA